MILQETDELTTLREVLRDYLGQWEVGAAAEGEPRYDPAAWRRACVELGFAGVAEPEELGGVGLGFAGLSVVLEEAGRVVSPLPLLSSVVLGQGLLTLSGDEQAQADYLPPLLRGDRIATVALEDGPGAPVDSPATVAEKDPQGGWVLNGSKSYVLDGLGADLVFVSAQTHEGRSLFAVEGAADGLTRTRVESMDLTREFAELRLEAVPARLIGTPGGGDDVLAQLAVRRTVAVSCEQLGGAARALEMAVEYLGIRVQFGRVIGSFQALKHRCADLAIGVDEARSAVAHAVWAADVAPAGLPLAAAMAGAVCASTYADCTAEGVHLHGGTGFTWEHPAHLYFRRAVSDNALYGDARQHREAVLAAAGI